MTRAWLTPMLLLALAAPVAAQAPASAAECPVRRGIDTGNAAYIAAFARADARALAQVYAPEGARLNDDGSAVQGRTAIAADVGAFVARVGPVTVELKTAQVWRLGDTAYETGLWSYSYHPEGQAAQRIGGRYVTVWRRQGDGGWKILADMGVPGT